MKSNNNKFNLKKGTLLLTIFLLSFIAISSIAMDTSHAVPYSIDNTTDTNTTINNRLGSDTDVTFYLAPGNYNISNTITISGVRNVTIIGNSSNRNDIVLDANNLRGIFTATNGANIKLQNLTLKNGKTTDRGGAININNGVLEVINCQFINNHANNYGFGGAIYSESNSGISNVVVSGSTFTNNSAASGGAIYSYGSSGSSVVVNGSTFTDNSATVSGGAIYSTSSSGSSVVVNGSTFTDNSASSYGGAILTESDNGISSVNVIGSSFLNNSATRNGGAIYIESYSGSSDVSFCVFYNNTGNKVIYKGGYGSFVVDNNWWGTNNLTDIQSYLYSVILNNYFIMNITRNNVTYYGDKLIISYSLVTSDTGSAVNASKLPLFYVDIIYNGVILRSLDARENTTVNTTVNQLLGNNVSTNFTGVNALLFNVSIANTTIAIPDVKGTVNDSVILIATLIDKSSQPVSGKLVYFYVDGTLVGNATTDINGVARFTYLAKNIGNFTWYANFTGDGNYTNCTSNIKNLEIVNKDVGSGNVVVNPNIPVGSGFVNSRLNISLDVPNGFGYIPGEWMTIKWTFTGIKNQGQKVNISFYDNGKWQHTIIANLANGKLVYKIKLTHKSLDVIVTFNGDMNNSASKAKVRTFVDPKNSRRTFITVKALNNLTVNKKGTLRILLKNYKGQTINKGLVVLQFDNYQKYNLTINKGYIDFSKVFIKSGNRLVKISYLGQGVNRKSNTKVTMKVKPATA